MMILIYVCILLYKKHKHLYEWLGELKIKENKNKSWKGLKGGRGILTRGAEDDLKSVKNCDSSVGARHQRPTSAHTPTTVPTTSVMKQKATIKTKSTNDWFAKTDLGYTRCSFTYHFTALWQHTKILFSITRKLSIFNFVTKKEKNIAVNFCTQQLIDNLRICTVRCHYTCISGVNIVTVSSET